MTWKLKARNERRLSENSSDSRSSTMTPTARIGAFQKQQDAGKATPTKIYRKEPLGPTNPLKAEFEQQRKNRDTARKARFIEIQEDYRRKAAAVRSANHDASDRVQSQTDFDVNVVFPFIMALTIIEVACSSPTTSNSSDTTPKIR